MTSPWEQAIPKTLAKAATPVAKKTTASAAGSTKWVWPTVSKRISGAPEPGHTAIDIAGKRGDPVFAPVSGTVSDIKWQPKGYGLNVRITTDTGLTVVLAHLDATLKDLKKGAQVVAGQVVGVLGSTGNSSGPHLHFEVREPGRAEDRFQLGTRSAIGAIDPRPFLVGGSTQSATLKPGSLNWAPTTQPAVTLSPPSSQPTIAGQYVAPVTTATPMVTGAIPFAPQVNRIGQQQAAAKGAPASAPGVRIPSTPLGDVTVPNPGELALKFVLITVGVMIVLIALAVIVLPRAKKLIADPAKERLDDLARLAWQGKTKSGKDITAPLKGEASAVATPQARLVAAGTRKIIRRRRK